MATVGVDGADYLARLEGLGISTEYVKQVGDTMTAQAMIMTDLDNNQITAFSVVTVTIWPSALFLKYAPTPRARRSKIPPRMNHFALDCLRGATPAGASFETEGAGFIGGSAKKKGGQTKASRQLRQADRFPSGKNTCGRPHNESATQHN